MTISLKLEEKLLLIKCLIELKADVNLKDGFGLPAITYAISNTSIKIDEKIQLVKCLVAGGADVDAVNNFGYTPITYVVSDTCSIKLEEKLQLIKCLIELKDDVNLKDGFELPAITYAVSNTSIKIDEKIQLVKCLVKQGADVNVKDGRGYTPITDAISNTSITIDEKIQLVKCLVEQGAGVNVKNGRGHTPLTQALVNPLKTLDEKLQLVKCLVDGGADVNLSDQSGYTPLFLATTSGSIRDFLISVGADQKAANSQWSLKYLSLSWGLKGRGEYVNQTLNQKESLALEGLYVVVFPQFLNLMLNFALHDQKIPTSEQKYLESIFSLINESNREVDLLNKIHSQPNDEQYRSFGEKKPRFFLSGTSDHSIGIILNENDLYICNRGVGRFLSNGIIKHLIDRYSPEFVPALKQFLQPSLIPTTIEFDSILNSISVKTQYYFPQKQQKVGNCTWTSTESALLALLFVFGLSEKEAKAAYKRFTGSVRRESLLNYLKEEYLDVNVLVSIRTKLIDDKSHFSPEERDALLLKVNEAIEKAKTNSF